MTKYLSEPLRILLINAINSNIEVESRYPGPFEPVTEEEFKRALKIAHAVVAWAESKID